MGTDLPGGATAVLRLLPPLRGFHGISLQIPGLASGAIRRTADRHSVAEDTEHVLSQRQTGSLQENTPG